MANFNVLLKRLKQVFAKGLVYTQRSCTPLDEEMAWWSYIICALKKMLY